MTEEEEKPKKKKEFELIQVPTQFGLAVQTPEGETLSIEQLLVQIANEVRRVGRNIG